MTGCPALWKAHLSVDVPELGVTIRMVFPLQGLAVGLKAVADLVEQAAYRVVADLVAACHQFLGQVAGALGCPKQGRFGVSAGDGLEQALEILEQSWVALREARPSGSRPANPLGRWFGHGLVEFGDSGSESRPRDARGFGDG